MNINSLKMPALITSTLLAGLTGCNMTANYQEVAVVEEQSVAVTEQVTKKAAAAVTVQKSKGNFPSLAPLGPVPVPADNPMTPEKVELGKKLFFDGRVGGDGSTPCVACHLPSLGWDFPQDVSLGYPGTIHWRNSPTIINTAYYNKLFWTGTSKSLEAEAKTAAKGAVAGNGEDDVMEARLAFVPEYVESFNKVFGDDWPKINSVWLAIAAFERTLVQTDTPLDRFLEGDTNALTDAQKRGKQLFEGKANCLACHNGSLASDQAMYNIGVPPIKRWKEDPLSQITFRYELYAKGSNEKLYRETKADPGAYFLGKFESMKGTFRTPSLRYTKYTAPYMHNGALATLEDVVDFYDRGGVTADGRTTGFPKTKSELIKPLGLNKEEKADLLAFLDAFSGEKITMEYPQLPPSEQLFSEEEISEKVLMEAKQ